METIANIQTVATLTKENDFYEKYVAAVTEFYQWVNKLSYF